MNIPAGWEVVKPEHFRVGDVIICHFDRAEGDTASPFSDYSYHIVSWDGEVYGYKEGRRDGMGMFSRGEKVYFTNSLGWSIPDSANHRWVREIKELQYDPNQQPDQEDDL